MRRFEGPARPRCGQRGFSLVELMIVVAIVGILASLSTYGVRRYLTHSKTAEALQNVGGMGRAVHAAVARENMEAALLASNESSTSGGPSNGNGNSNGNSNGNNGKGNQNGKGNNGNNGNGATVTRNIPGLCGASTSVPSSMAKVKGKKYQPSPSDYQTGDRYTGWRCLMFSIASPQYYQYQYTVAGPPVNVTLPHGGVPPGLDRESTWSAAAQGDLDGDGITSWFILMGYLKDEQTVVQATTIDQQDPEE